MKKGRERKKSIIRIERRIEESKSVEVEEFGRDTWNFVTDSSFNGDLRFDCLRCLGSLLWRVNSKGT